jgi:DNA-binding NarL/FixJ family response regulator
MQAALKSRTKILIVDDHPMVISGCRSLFASDASVEIEEASDAKSGERTFGRVSPDVTVIDINLPDISGFELMRRIDPQQTFASLDGQYRFLLHRHYAANSKRSLQNVAIRSSCSKQSQANAGLSLS